MEWHAELLLTFFLVVGLSNVLFFAFVKYWRRSKAERGAKQARTIEDDMFLHVSLTNRKLAQRRVAGKFSGRSGSSVSYRTLYTR
jgi:hypothetical protein